MATNNEFIVISTFMQRAYDQVIDVCAGITRDFLLGQAGFAGADGPTTEHTMCTCVAFQT
jgi:deoxyxylulose-5-phosphate synthase